MSASLAVDVSCLACGAEVVRMEADPGDDVQMPDHECQPDPPAILKVPDGWYEATEPVTGRRFLWKMAPAGHLMFRDHPAPVAVDAPEVPDAE